MEGGKKTLGAAVGVGLALYFGKEATKKRNEEIQKGR